jgi:hypothetical protein
LFLKIISRLWNLPFRTSIGRSFSSACNSSMNQPKETLVSRFSSAACPKQLSLSINSSKS